MKKIPTTILFAAIFLLLLSKSSFAQGNLQFNQVILFDIAASGTQAITVPAGKVWKIESVSMGSTSSNADIFLRNASAIAIAHFSGPATANTAIYPYWLPTSFTGSFVNNHPSFRCSISIIEFNVVP
jgi:hypothetical protein